MKLTSLFISFSLATALYSQEISDSEAISYLSAISSAYQEHDQHRINFFLDIELPGEAKESQQGSLLHEGDNFVLELDGRTVISDGSTLWLYLEEMNEVQINDAELNEDEDMLMRPSDLFNLHNSDKFIFVVAGQLSEGGENVIQIEGKPTDSDSDYSKVRITLSDNGQTIKRFKVFSKDGSRFTMRLSQVNSNVVFDEKTFSFDPANYPGVHVEDLRF